MKQPLLVADCLGQSQLEILQHTHSCPGLKGKQVKRCQIKVGNKTLSLHISYPAAERELCVCLLPAATQAVPFTPGISLSFGLDFSLR